MKQLFYLFIALLFLGFTACTSSTKKEKKADGEETTEEVVAAPNTLTDQEKKEGWILMFDGETTNGWREYDNEVFPDTGWSYRRWHAGLRKFRERGSRFRW